MTSVRLDAIVFDAGTQVREAINEQVVRDYADRLSDGVEFPPVVLFHDGNRYFMADGFHRGMAHLRIGRDAIAADVRPGTREDALWFALGANKTNGSRMTEADKRHAIIVALGVWPDKSAAVIAEQVGCSKAFASTVRNGVSSALHLPERVTGADGRSYPASPAARKTARERAKEMLAAGTDNATVQADTKIGRDTLYELRRELGLSVDKTETAVRSRQAKIRELADAGYTTRQIAATVDLAPETVSAFTRRAGIAVQADAVVGKSKRHDSNRIVGQIVADAENLTAGADLVDFHSLDRALLAEWVTSLQASRDALGSFIRRLSKELSHGQVA